MSMSTWEEISQQIERSGEHLRVSQHADPLTSRLPVDRPSGGRPKVRHIWWGAGLVATISLVAGSGFAFYQSSFPAPSPSAAADSEHDSVTLRRVQLDSPSPAAAGSVTLPATIRPWQITTLHARVSGYLTSWYQDLGARVARGQVLAEIQTPELDQELAEGHSLYLEAVAATVQAKAELAEAHADLSFAEAQLTKVRAEVELARIQVSRRAKLVPTRAISQEEYDTFVTQLETRKAEVIAAESDVFRRKANLETRTAIIQARDATAKGRLADVERLKELQSFKRIVAPFDGVITSRTAEIGMLVNAGKEALFIIQDVDRVRVQVHVPQSYSALTKPGASAMVTLPESLGQVSHAQISRISDSVDATNRTMLAEIELSNVTGRFQPGSYAQVNLGTASDETVWTIPANTLSMRIDGVQVAVVDSENRIALRPVTLGRDLGNRITVVAGIQGHERLVVNPSDDLVTGMSVEINHPMPPPLKNATD